MLSRLHLPPRAVLAIDGHGASGKTTLARRLAAEHSAACVVGTDDLAWHHSFFDWADLLIDAVLLPYRAGHAVSYRPPGWVKMGREGSIEVPAEAEKFWDEGMAEEIPFLNRHRPWERADLIVG